MGRRAKTATVYEIKERHDLTGGNVRHVVRWKVDGRPGTSPMRTFSGLNDAQTFYDELCEAAVDRELFDMVTGLPASMVPEDQTTIAAWCKMFCERDFKAYGQKSRANLVDDLVPLIVRSAPDRAPALSQDQCLEVARWLAGEALSREVASWFEKWSPRLTDLRRADLVRILERVCLRQSLETKLGPSTASNRRSHVRQVMNDAVNRGLIAPLDWAPALRGAKKKSERTDSRIVLEAISPATLMELVARSHNRNCRSRKYQVKTAIAGWAGLRPSEVYGLEVPDLTLPPEGWGAIMVDETRVPADKRYEMDGDLEFDIPKSPNSKRNVPIPPVLVKLILSYVVEEGITGRIFPDGFGARHWPDSLALAAKKVGIERLSPYSLRRAYASHLSEVGFSAADIAKRMGNTPKTVVEHYLLPVSGRAAATNAALEAFYSSPQ